MRQLDSVLAAGLGFVHDQRYLHRDVKPGNILIGGFRGLVRVRMYTQKVDANSYGATVYFIIMRMAPDTEDKSTPGWPETNAFVPRLLEADPD
ncbi:hypothetical protein BGX23_001061 [Mortierella sp. AD031]|nr:hypothetical protein BGX23_001061 [Mortierella sp. AD031]